MLPLFGTLAAIGIWLWVQYLPGYVVSRVVDPTLTGTRRHGLALFCGFSTVPFAVFLLSVAAGVPMDGPLVLLTVTALNIGGLFYQQPWRQPQVGRTDSALLVVGFLLACVYLAFGIRSLDGGDVFSTVHHCLYVIVMHTVGNDPMIGLPMYDGLGDQIVHYLVSHPTDEFNGLAPLFFEQRLGNAPILAPAVALFGTAGWFVTTVYATVVTGVCTYLASRAVGARGWIALLCAVVFAWGIRAFCMYFVNENNYAIAIVAFLLWAALEAPTKKTWIVLLGITAGHLVGVRYTSSLFWPAIAVAVIWTPGTVRQRAVRFALGAVPALLTLTPTLYVNWIMLGSAFTHPKVHSEFASRIVENSLLGWTFEFRALNWPFTDRFVRTAWNPFPTLLWLPLTIGKCFGHVFTAASVLGWLAALKHKRTLVLLVLFSVPHTLAIGWLETLDWEQLTYSAPGLVVLAPTMALGLEALLAGWLEGGEARRRPLVAALVAVIAVTAGFFSIRYTTWPVDTRNLPTEHWTESPGLDKGAKAVGEWLTTPSPLPMWPVWRTSFATVTWQAMGAIVTGSEAVEGATDALAYPSAGVAILSGYSPKNTTAYQFELIGRDARTTESTVRSSLGLHVVTLTLPAERIRFDVRRDRGVYDIYTRVARVGDAPRDFTFYLHPWFPPVRSIRIWDGAPDQPGKPTPLPNVRVLAYGGDPEFGERRFVATNYDKDIVDVVEIPFTVDLNGEPAHCGLFVFLTDVDTDRVETVVLAGGHDESWNGQTSGTITVPKNVLADRVVLYSEPYCSDHVPQPGDRYSVIEGPFLPDRPLNFRLDRQW